MHAIVISHAPTCAVAWLPHAPSCTHTHTHTRTGWWQTGTSTIHISIIDRSTVATAPQHEPSPCSAWSLCACNASNRLNANWGGRAGRVPGSARSTAPTTTTATRWVWARWSERAKLARPPFNRTCTRGGRVFARYNPSEARLSAVCGADDVTDSTSPTFARLADLVKHYTFHPLSKKLGKACRAHPPACVCVPCALPRPAPPPVLYPRRRRQAVPRRGCLLVGTFEAWWWQRWWWWWWW